MIVVYLKFWIMILKVLLLNLEYKWEQFNDLHFSSKMKHMWNPDCDLTLTSNSFQKQTKSINCSGNGCYRYMYIRHVYSLA